MSGMTLYQLSGQWREAYETLSQDAELDAQTFADTMEALTGDVQEKAKNVAAFVGNLEASVSAMKEAEKRMAQRRKSAENRLKWLYGYLLENMQRCDITRIEAPEYVIRRQLNPPSVRIGSAEALPPKYLRVPPPEPDKAAIKDALKAGEDVPGAYLERGERVVIR